MKRYLFMISLSLIMAMPVFAEQAMISFGLNGQPIELKQAAAYIEPKAPDIKGHVLEVLQNTSFETVSKAATEPTQTTLTMFPVISTVMSPGKIESRKVELLPLPQPIFIIGSDDFSKSWLKQHVKQLQPLNALGFLTEVQNQTDFEAIKNIANGLVIIPMSCDSLARQFNINHYPVLISQKAIEQ